MRSAGACAFHCPTVTGRNSLPSADFGRPRYLLEVDAALRPGNGTTFAPSTQTDRRQLAGGRDLHPDQGQVALTYIVRWILPARPSTFSSRPSRTRPHQKRFLSKRWDGRIIPCRASSTPTVTARIRPAIVRLKAEGALDEDCRAPAGAAAK